MGMDVDPVSGGLSPKRGYLTDKILNMEELQSDQMPHCHIKEYNTLIDSSSMGKEEWGMIARDIQENYYDFDGFVVIMGTDTMSYAATALSFMLENLGKTVVFTGSQIPFIEVYNDARRNLIASIIFAGNQDFCEVVLFFNAKLLRGNRSVKVNSFGLDAFDCPNFPPLAELGVNVELRKDIALPPPHGPFRIFTKMETGIVVMKLIPKFDDEPLRQLVMHSEKIKAIILEMYGTGNISDSDDKTSLLNVIELARKRNIIVVAVSQCYKGSVMLGKYAVGSELITLDVCSGGDMTTESVSIKLAYLLAKVGNDREKINRLMEVNLRGELSDSTKYEAGIFHSHGSGISNSVSKL